MQPPQAVLITGHCYFTRLTYRGPDGDAAWEPWNDGGIVNIGILSVPSYAVYIRRTPFSIVRESFPSLSRIVEVPVPERIGSY